MYMSSEDGTIGQLAATVPRNSFHPIPKIINKRQCMYNVRVRHVHIMTLAVEKQ